jgi:hypothetical protein
MFIWYATETVARQHQENLTTDAERSRVRRTTVRRRRRPRDRTS